MKYHTDVIKTAFKYLNRLQRQSKRSIRDLASETAVYTGIRIIDFFKLVQDKYNVDLSEEIEELRKFYE